MFLILVGKEKAPEGACSKDVGFANFSVSIDARTG
jgi:hypothetical protein